MAQTYISFLRGINVSGQKKILTSGLKLLYKRLVFKQIRTYIQSGNIIFESNEPLTNESLSKKIEQKIADIYSFNVSVFVETVSDFEAINALYPFSKIPDLNPKKIFVTLLNCKSAYYRYI